MAGSETEIRTREGFPYGGLPHDALLRKLEETDPDLVDEVRGADPLADSDDLYRDYVRAEATDWTPDAPYLESDHPTRDPGGLSRSRLNLTYNGTRGSDPELPRHPELFYGFTGNDPRGALTDPRFDRVRGHVTSRAADLTARMGDNDDHDVAERPWTNQAISYGMKEVQRRLKNSTRVFTSQKEGRPWGRNTVARELGLSGDPRAWTLEAGAESLETGARFVSGDHRGGAERFGASRPGLGPAEETGGWRHSSGDAELGRGRRGQARAGGAPPGAATLGGGQARAARPAQSWARSEGARRANRQTLGAAMALAARGAGRRPGEQDFGAEPGEPRAAGAGLAPRDVARVYRAVTGDQSRGGQPGAGAGTARLGSAAGLAPAAHPEHALRRTDASVRAGTHADVAAIVAGVREGTAAARRRVAGMVAADGVRLSAAAEAPTRAGAIPADGARAARLGEASLIRAGAAESRAALYRSAAPTRPEARAETAQDAFDAQTWRANSTAPPPARQRRPEQRVPLRDGAELGAADGSTFGAADETRGAGGAPTGPKSLRAGAWSATAELADGAERGPGFGAD